MEIVRVVTNHGRRAVALPVAVARVPATAAGQVLAVVARIDRVLRSVEELAVGVGRLEAEMRGMRSDVRAVTGRVDLLREEFAHVADEVHAIGATTTQMGTNVEPLGGLAAALDEHLDEMSASLRRIDGLASRIGRWGRREPRERAA